MVVRSGGGLWIYGRCGLPWHAALQRLTYRSLSGELACAIMGMCNDGLVFSWACAIMGLCNHGHVQSWACVFLGM